MQAKPRPRRLGRWLTALGAVAVLTGAVLVAACQRGVESVPNHNQPNEPPGPSGPPFFEDVTKASGIDHTYRNGEEAGHYAILESLGGGAALIDYDGDGLLDVFLTGGGYYENKGGKPVIRGHPSKLYKNLGNWKFKDVTKEAGLDGPEFYTHGAAVADYDRDGWPDLLVTGWGRVVLYHNVSDGKGGRRFVDVTDQAGLTDPSWSSSAAWGDLNGDGYPDLYVCHYANWSFDNSPECTYDGRTRDVCPPKTFHALPHRLFKNNGDGTFTDVSKEAGLRVPRQPKDYDQLTHLGPQAIERLKQADQPGKPDGPEFGKGMCALLVDLNGDGRPDIYVANDTVDNFLYMNRGKDGKILLEELGFVAGVARDDRGQPDGSMGLAAGDPFDLGRPSLWVTNYENELHCLYKNECRDGREFFLFGTQTSGIAAIGKSYVGWGTTFLDVDHHGWEDLFIVNGHAIRFPTGKAPRAQNQLFLRNVGNGKYKDYSAQAGDYFQTKHVSRGVAFGDLDNDGRIDAVINHLNEPVAVLKNVADVGNNHWLGVELAGKKHADVVGTKLVLEVNGRKQTRFAQGGGSYASSSDRRLVFGLGPADKVGKLTVKWPGGQELPFDGLAVDRYWRLTDVEEEPQQPKAGKPESR